MVGVLLGLAVVELLVVHLVFVAMFGRVAALIVGVVDLSMVILLLALLKSFRRMPVTLSNGVLTMRAGFLKTVAVPVSQIAALRPSWDVAALKQTGVVNLAIGSWPSVVIDLDPPVLTRRGRAIHAVAHKLDDPAAFHAAIMALSVPTAP